MSVSIHNQRIALMNSYIEARLNKQTSTLLAMFSQDGGVQDLEHNFHQGREALTTYFNAPQKATPTSDPAKFENDQYYINLQYVGGWKTIHAEFQFVGASITIQKIILTSIGWI